ncbi:MAG TPA: amidophosphoribosyltransferase [Bacillota bacterium]|nr:amidophosphoribosyltransferase [Bacillota bacterium]
MNMESHLPGSMHHHCSLEDKPEEACGVFGVYSDEPDFNAATLTYLGLYALQHRGQESAGMVVSDGQQMKIHKNMGLVANVFNKDILGSLTGRIGLGHVRYSTTGSSQLINAQPLMARCSHGILAVAHNGNLVNTEELRRQLEDNGSVFQTTTDTEVIINLIARYSHESLENAVLKAAQALKGSFSIILMNNDTLIGLRDPYGVRPMCLGKISQSSLTEGKNADAYVISSESCAFTSIGASFVRDIAPGEMVAIDRNGLRSFQLPAAPGRALCVFEYIYFARPDSNIDGLNAHLARKAMGRELARQFTRTADVVIPVPDTGLSTAIGFSEASGIPFDIGLIKNTYVGRTFIQPHQNMRDLGVKIKLNPVQGVLQDRRVIVIDDTIVRGTTTRRIVRLLREAGAKEVHMLISAPPITHPCYYGIDTSIRKELIASDHSVAEIQEFIEADSLIYLTLDGLNRAVNQKPGLCVACFNGDYPISLPANGSNKMIFE